ncbi:glycosyltransferase family 4 protein [Yonghaparkia sp. Root332]|uniref:glycosyltransferase family 4 protein n=1 Tax=Yonghaparkia sp. Root332 TaxID=1736516 RepID=UPI0006F6A4F5|nr:glycosyltransferase family 4 protein [Yonghaparkia sp. Root332]KQV25476.1 hypothetical protein ASC54_00235 [Yonghaparkia sp. Root332]
MRVVIASRIFSPEPAAAAFRLEALAKALVARGHEVEVLTSRPPASQRIADAAGVTVRRAPVLRDRSGAVRGYVQYLSFDVPLIARLLMARRADAVVVEPPPTTGAVVRLVCALRRTPYLYYAGDILADAAGSAGSPAPVVAAVRRLERLSWGGAARVLSVSESVSARLRELGVAADRIAEVGNGIDTGVFSPEGEAVERDEPYALYAGTASEVHGAGVFVEAMASVTGMRLVFLGAGVERDALRARAEAIAPGRVEFLDTVPATEVARWLRGARVAVASVKPEGGYGFAFPTKMYAAVSTGTPVLYAGEGPGRAFAESAPLARAVDHDADAVAAALRDARDERPTPAARAELARWARVEISLGAAAERAADAVELLAPR